MNKLLTGATLAMLIAGTSAHAQDEAKKDTTGFKFTTVKEIPITSIKNQNQSGTCWCYSTLSFFESELLKAGRMGFE